MHAHPPKYIPGLARPARSLVMGVVNVTPDSFSDGGSWLDPAAAVAHGRELARQGADIIDVGGESTRPGATRPSAQEELDRVLPVVRALADHAVSVSIDTMRSEVAEAALGEGAVLVNDVSGGRADPGMLGTVAAAGAPYVLMHWRAHSNRMQEHAEYDDVVAEVTTEIAEQLQQAKAAGIPAERIAVDPGIGFAKTSDQNWQLLAAVEELHGLGHPVLVATSRKRFLGELLMDREGEERPTAERDAATTATSALLAAAGVWCIRTHAVRPTADAVRVATRWARAASRHG